MPAGVRVLDADHGVAPSASISPARIDVSSREAIEAGAADLGDAPIDILVSELHDSGVSVLELVTRGIDTDMMSQVQDQLREHVHTDGRDRVEPGDWAQKVVDQLNPGSAERLASLLPRTLREFGIRHLLSR